MSTTEDQNYRLNYGSSFGGDLQSLQDQLSGTNIPTQPAEDEEKIQILSDDGHGLTFVPGVLAFVSTIVGGGIVGIPYCFYNLGLPFGVVVNLIVIGFTIYSIYLYCLAKDLTKDKQSFSEIGYLAWGRISIFVVNFIIFFNCIGLCMVYFIVFSQTAANLVSLAVSSANSDAWYVQDWLYVLVIAAICSPLCFKKEIKELKIISYSLFAAIIIFIFFLGLQLIFGGRSYNPDGDSGTYVSIIYGYGFWSSISTLLVAYGFQMNFYFAYQNFKVKTNMNGILISSAALFTCFIIYFLVGIISVYMFGSSISSDVLTQIGYIDDWESYTIQVSFCIVLACHIPFIFYSGKECWIAMVWEISDKSISKMLDKKIRAENRAQQRRNSYSIITIEEGQEGHPHMREREDSIITARYSEILDINNARPWQYYGWTLFIYVVAILGSIFIGNVQTIFNFVGSIAGSCQSFIIPGGFIVALVPKCSERYLIGSDEKIKNIVISSWIMIVIGVITMILLLWNNIYGLVEGYE